MQATVELPEAVLRELEIMARNEGTTAADLIRRIVEAHVTGIQPDSELFSVSLPLIPAGETGRIDPVYGPDVDELLSRDHFAA